MGRTNEAMDTHELPPSPEPLLLKPTSEASPAAPSRRTWKGWLLQLFVWTALLGLFAYAFYLVLAPKEKSKTPSSGGRRGVSGAITITTATAQKGDIGVYIESIGTVTPFYTASIFSQVTGMVVAVNFKEGQLIKKGDSLIDIDARPFQATLLQAQGTLERDQNVLQQARMDLDRYKAAWARNAVAKQILDDQEKLVRQDQGTEKNDQGTVQFDQLQVEYCHIVAPIPGRVGLRLVDPGNLVTAGGNANASPLVVITQMQPITVVFTIPEDSLGAVQAQLRKDAKLAVNVFDHTAQTQIGTGEVVALDNQIDTTTGTLRVRAVFGNDDLALFPNQFVNVRLLVETLKGVTLIPSAAIQQNGQTSFVYVIEDGVAHLRKIKPGVAESKSGQTQVEGINPGDAIANSSFDKLQDGDKVVPAGSKPAEGDKPAGTGTHKHDGKPS